MIREVCIIVHNCTCIPPTLVAIVLTCRARPLKNHILPLKIPSTYIIRNQRGSAEWGIHHSLPSACLLASARVNMSPVPCPQLTFIAQVSSVTRNVYSRPDTHSVTSILARGTGPLEFYARCNFTRLHSSQTRGPGHFSGLNKQVWPGPRMEISSDIERLTALRVPALSARPIVVSRLGVGRAGDWVIKSSD